MQRKNNHVYSTFFRAFGVTLLLMGVVLATVCLAFYLRQNRPEQDVSQLPTVYLPRKEERLNILLTGAEDGLTDPDCYLLFGFLPDKGRIALCMLPPKTYVEYGGEATTLQGLYQKGGIAYTRKALEQYLQIPLDRWAKMDVEGLSRLMSMTGLMDYYLPVDLNGKLHGRKVVMPKGSYSLDGRKTYDILAYPSYKGGEVERSDRGAMLVSQLVSENLPAFLTDVGDKLIKAVLDVMETDLSYKDYETRKSAASFLAKLDLPATAVVYIEGSMSVDKTIFYLTPGCMNRIQEMYLADDEAIATKPVGEAAAIQDNR